MAQPKQSILSNIICPKCGYENTTGSSECVRCGVIFAKANTRPSTAKHFRPLKLDTSKYTTSSTDIDALNRQFKSPVLAAIVNFIIPGFGYFYLGRIGRGFLILAVLFFFGLLALAIPGVALFLISLLSIATAIGGYLRGNEYNHDIQAKIDMAMKKCPHCAERILPEAKICKHCKSKLD